MEHELRALRVQLVEKSKRAIQLQKEVFLFSKILPSFMGFG